MHNLFLSEGDLNRRRLNLPARFKCLTPDPSYIQAAFRPVGRYTKAIAIHQGQRMPLPYEQWRVTLMTLNVSVGYFEIWQYSSHPGTPPHYLLQRAYLHIYLRGGLGGEQDLLFLHCDPQEPEDSLHYRYKVAPHLHLEIAGAPWKDAHVPLCDGWQKEVLRSLDDLDKAIARGIQFIADQFLPLIQAGH